MDFKADSQKVSFQSVNDKMSSLNRATESVTTSTNFGFNKSEHFSTVGLNANKIPAMKQALADYIDTVNEHLNKINTVVEDKLPTAFKGDYANKIISYLDSFKMCCKVLVNGLKEFDVKLDEVAASYAKVSEQLTSNVSTAESTLISDFASTL